METDAVASELIVKQLEMTEEFYPRIEAKASFLLALNMAMLVLVALNFQPADMHRWYTISSAALSFGFLFLSSYHCYRCVLPNLTGEDTSLIFFDRIGRLTKDEFVQKFENLTGANYRTDLLTQIWQNSRILRVKFSIVRKAFLMLGVGSIFWLAFLVCVTLTHQQIVVKI